MSVIDEISNVLGKAAVDYAWKIAKVENRKPTVDEINEAFKIFFGKRASYKRVVSPSDYKLKVHFDILDE